MAKPLVEINGKDATAPVLLVMAVVVGLIIFSFMDNEPEVQVKQPEKVRKVVEPPAKKPVEEVKTVGEVNRSPVIKPAGKAKKRAKPKTLTPEQLKPTVRESGLSHASKQITEGVDPDDVYEIISEDEPLENDGSIEELEERDNELITY